MNENKTVTKTGCNADKFEVFCKNCYTKWYTTKKIKQTYERLKWKKRPTATDTQYIITEDNQLVRIKGERDVDEKEWKEYKDNPMEKKILHRFTGYINECPRCIGDRKKSQQMHDEYGMRKIRVDKETGWKKRMKTRQQTRERVRRYRERQKQKDGE